MPSAKVMNGTEAPSALVGVESTGGLLTGGRSGERRTYPLAQLEKVVLATPKNRAASATE